MGLGNSFGTLDDTGGPLSRSDRSRVDAAALRGVELFADLADDELAWIAERAQRIELAPGQRMFEPGDSAEWMFIALEGVLQARREHLGPTAPAFVLRAGDIGGTIPFSRMTQFNATGRAVTRAVVARFPKSLFGDLLRRIPRLESRMVQHLVDRVRDATRREAQLEKLAALGKLSAGMAHELNNPTAAVLRVVGEANRRLDERGRLTATLVSSGVTSVAVERLDAMRRAAQTRRKEALDDALARSDREDTLARWLGAKGMAESWSRAATFVEAGLDERLLSDALSDVPPAGHLAALEWLEIGLSTQTIFASVDHAAKRIAELVDLMRTYTHRDRGRGIEDVDIREGIDSTLTLFAGPAREKGVMLERDLARELPRIRGYPAELNQVWSNLVDNAIDAAPQTGGRVLVSASATDHSLVAEIRDNGGGIPSSIRDRIFEPFFTTKEVGHGTGLGLDTARRIVADLHGGELSFTSEPGDTRFVVTLPLATVSNFGA
jgi:signal transduction histidine kinase